MKNFPFLTAARIVLGALFFWSGFLKLIQPWQNFQAVIETYQIVQGDPVRWMAQVIPWIEALFGLYLVAGLYIRPATAVLWALNTAFVTALASAVLRKLPIDDCGCFGDSFSLPLPVMLAVDAVLWLGFAAVFLRAASAGRWSLDARFSRSNSNPTRRKK